MFSSIMWLHIHGTCNEKQNDNIRGCLTLVLYISDCFVILRHNHKQLQTLSLDKNNNYSMYLLIQECLNPA